jgi:alanine racemase
VTLAVIPAGYADGLDRRLENHGFVLIRGQRAKIVGAVSMDMLTADVTDIGGVGLGMRWCSLDRRATNQSTRERWRIGSARSRTKSCAVSVRE